LAVHGPVRLAIAELPVAIIFPSRAAIFCPVETAVARAIFNLGASQGINRAERESLLARCSREVNLVKAGTIQRSFISGLLLVVTELASANDANSIALVGDPVRGKALYQACTACHSVDENDLGPKHRGVFGRRAGSVADYSYSAALKASGLTWDRSTLDRWLANPSQLVPGTKMYLQISDAQRRADVIAYLEQLK
jgi:cytochrome c